MNLDNSSINMGDLGQELFEIGVKFRDIGQEFHEIGV